MRKFNYERGDRIYTKDGKETKWKYLKDTVSNGRSERRVIVECDCGNITSTNLYHIVDGRSTKCVECSLKERKGRKIGVNPDSLIQKSLEIGKSRTFFSHIKNRYPKKFKEMMSLGKGDIASGYYRYMALKPYRKYLRKNSLKGIAKELGLRETYFYTLKNDNIDMFIKMLELGNGDLKKGYRVYKDKFIPLTEASIRIGKKKRYFSVLKQIAPGIFYEIEELGDGDMVKGYELYIKIYGQIKIKGV